MRNCKGVGLSRYVPIRSRKGSNVSLDEDGNALHFEKLAMRALTAFKKVEQGREMPLYR